MGNIINFFAIMRAVFQYTMDRIRGKNLVWDKTTHQVPTMGVEQEIEYDGKATNVESFKVPLNPQALNRKIITAISEFEKNIQSGIENHRVDAIHALDRDSGPWLYPDLMMLITDPSWRIRAEVCRTLSFLCYAQALPQLEKTATDPDWTVCSNAVRAIGKLGDLGEHTLLNILKGDDRFAREAALAVLEHQGFLKTKQSKILQS